MARLAGANDNAGTVVRHDIHISVVALDRRMRTHGNRIVVRVVGLDGHRRGQVRESVSLGRMRLVFGRRACHDARSLPLLEYAEDEGDMSCVVRVFEPLGDTRDFVVGHEGRFKMGFSARYLL